MYTIVLIGAGQLGSRHLQSLAKINIPVQLEVIDPCKESLQVARQRFFEIPQNSNINSISFLQNDNHNLSDIDLCVVATNADVRAHVISQLLANRKVKNFVLEKVLFQDVEAYEKINSLFVKNNIKAWVNCPRRIYSIYREIKNIVENQRIDFIASGKNWGLGCNSIHFIDILSYLISTSQYEIHTTFLDTKMIQSKRKGFTEFTGILKGKFSNGTTFELESMLNEKGGVQIVISSDNFEIKVDESQGKAILKQKNNTWNEEIIESRIPFQSELTHLVAQDILQKGSCGLTPFEESCALHLPMIKAFNKFIGTIEGRDCPICPIT